MRKRNAPQERFERNAAFDTRKRRPQAVMDAEPKAQVAVFGPLNFQLLGAGECCRIAVGGGKYKAHCVAAPDRVSVQFDVLSGKTHGGALDRAVSMLTSLRPTVSRRATATACSALDARS